MKLSDIMSAAGLSIYAEVALLIFITVFVCVAFDVLRSARLHQAMRLLPLEDDTASRRARNGREAR